MSKHAPQTSIHYYPRFLQKIDCKRISTTHYHNFRYQMAKPNTQIIPCNVQYKGQKHNKECQKPIEQWIDRTTAFPNFSLHQYILNIHKSCVDAKVSKFIADCSQYQRMQVTSHVISILCEMAITDFQFLINRQHEQNNNIFKYISGNGEMMREIFNSKHFLFCLQTCPIETFLQFATTFNFRWSPQETLKIIGTVMQKNIPKVVEYFETKKSGYATLTNLICNNVSETLITQIAKHIIKPMTDEAVTKFINFIFSVMKRHHPSFIHSFIACDGLPITKQHLVIANFATCSSNVTDVANILDVFIINGLVVTKELAIYLAEHGKYINNFEKYGIPIDDELMRVCYANDIQVYSPSLNPPSSLLLQEVIKQNMKCGNGIKSVESIMKNYVNSGAKFDKTHFMLACREQDNAFLNYFHAQCGAKFDDDCLTAYYVTNLYADAKKIEVPKLVANNHYKTKHGVTNSTKKTVILNNNVLTTFNKSKMEIAKNTQYKIKPKPKTMLEYKGETIAFHELIDLLLKYLIKNKYAIGQYFVISGTFADMLGVADGIICQRQQLDIIASHFVL